jgi:LysM repeat protein
MRKQTLVLLGVGLLIALFAAQPAHQAAASPSAGNSYGYGYGYGHGNMHCVQYGETLYSIGLMHGVSAWAIAQHNGIVNPNYIRAGQCLSIPSGGNYGDHGGPGYGHGKPQYPPMMGHHPAKPACYVVMPGDTLSGIAWRHGVSPWSIAYANGLSNPDYIRCGQCLVIPGY